VYLNWALVLKAIGCRVIWLEELNSKFDTAEIEDARVVSLRNRLEAFGLGNGLALWSRNVFRPELAPRSLNLDAAADADLLLNQNYRLPAEVVERFRRSALLDIDPGLLQIWMSKGDLRVARHDVYFTIGETVGQPGARFPDAGLEWQYTPPCVALDWWSMQPIQHGLPFTTVSQWYADEWLEHDGKVFRNDKRCGFLPFLDLPQFTKPQLELALDLGSTNHERTILESKGWCVRDAHAVGGTPWDYQRYIQGSAGEFSCAKPSCVRLQNAWISDRTLCYLASGKPAVVQHTGASRFLPDASGLFRFRDVDDAARCLETVATDYDQQCRLARALAEEFFDARNVVKSVLERALA
jgi:hypothetical protein